ncbi:nucleoside deaminase [Nocardia sp. NPDC051570]|uniref:nucleoside deaminase n=1 Tax=Nocardia sp. NPDC051570 TaxID=3364324 RepID=UPI0037B36153
MRDAEIRVSRRAALGALGLAAVAGAVADQATASADPGPVTADDERFMRLAIHEARGADWPFGCVIVRDGDVVATGQNMGAHTHDPTGHAEMTAIRNYIATHSDGLKSATLYASGEPCPMCMGAILWSGIPRLVYALSIAELELHMDQILITSCQLAGAWKRPIDIVGGVLADEARGLLTNVWRKPR